MLTRFTYGGDRLREMRRLQSEVNRLFHSAIPSGVVSFPPMNVYATPDGIAITAELPGVAEDELEISVHRDTVTLTGERKDPVESEGSGEKSFHRHERGSFMIAAGSRGGEKHGADIRCGIRAFELIEGEGARKVFGQVSARNPWNFRRKPSFSSPAAGRWRSSD